MPSQLARTATPHTRSPPDPKRDRARHVFLGSRLCLRLPSHPPHGVAVAIDLWLVPSTSTGDSHPQAAGHAGRTRVAGAVARPGSHRTVLVLFTHGSSGRRVVNPAAGRLSTLAYPHSSANCSWVGATISSCQARCRSTSERRPRSAKYRGRSALSTCGTWLSAHRDLRP